MLERTYETPLGVIHYRVSERMEKNVPTLLFLPGLTADHRLFDKQIEIFEARGNIFTWDAPGHAASRPFELSFSIEDKARWLEEILLKEDIALPVIVGQSMGGYVGQVYAQLYPERLRGFIAIDSAPLALEYSAGWERWLLKRMEPVYRLYPWKSLLKAGSEGVSTTPYGQKLMYAMMSAYEKNEYARLAGHGYRMLAEAIERDLPCAIPCPALLICGTRDRAGSAMRYNKEWHRRTGLPIEWLEGAGHNANTDRPEETNRLIAAFLERLEKETV